MSLRLVSCSECQAALTGPEFFSSTALAPCPSCGAQQRVELFPAFFRDEVRGQQAERANPEGEASCFYHAPKKAVISCDACGRFLCALCDLELNGRHLCAVCLEHGQQKRSLTQLENQRVRYDNLALLMALAPILAWPFTLLTAPGTIFFSIRHWNSPTSIIRPTRVRLVAALILGVLEVAGWVVGLWYAFRH